MCLSRGWWDPGGSCGLMWRGRDTAKPQPSKKGGSKGPPAVFCWGLLVVWPHRKPEGQETAGGGRGRGIWGWGWMETFQHRSPLCRRKVDIQAGGRSLVRPLNFHKSLSLSLSACGPSQLQGAVANEQLRSPGPRSLLRKLTSTYVFSGR